MEQKYAVIDRTESFVKSLFSDLTTFSFLAFCIWLSMGSKWWTLVTGIMFLCFAFGKLATVMKARKKDFTTKQELFDWAETLKWD